MASCSAAHPSSVLRLSLLSRCCRPFTKMATCRWRARCGGGVGEGGRVEGMVGTTPTRQGRGYMPLPVCCRGMATCARKVHLSCPRRLRTRTTPCVPPNSSTHIHPTPTPTPLPTHLLLQLCRALGLPFHLRPRALKLMLRVLCRGTGTLSEPCAGSHCAAAPPPQARCALQVQVRARAHTHTHTHARPPARPPARLPARTHTRARTHTHAWRRPATWRWISRASRPLRACHTMPRRSLHHPGHKIMPWKWPTPAAATH